MTATRLDTPVVLVHGYASTGSCWVLVERSLRKAGFHTIASLSHHPLVGGIPVLAARLVRLAHSVMADTGTTRVHLVGHSLGGLIIRYAVCVLDFDPFVDTAITVATPHRGCRFAWLGPGAVAAQCRPNSQILRSIHAADRPGQTRWVSFYSDRDFIVPGKSAMIASDRLRAENVLLSHHNHMSILLSPRLAKGISTRLANARSSWPRAHETSTAS
jgi:pimeloyl-ACP methyl ester carboxylesterase